MMGEPAVVVCPNCMQKYRVPPERVGQRALCKRCGERFKIAAGEEIDDDTIFGWICEENPAGTSVMGSTSMFEPSAGEGAATAARWRRPPPPSSLRVRFVRLDRNGACFEFAARQLDDPELRCAFPHRCVHCLSPKNLSIHLLIWDGKLPRGDYQRLCEAEIRAVRKLDKLLEHDPEGWFDGLEPVVVLPRPFCNPFPYYTCSECGVIGEVRCQVRVREGVEYCQLTIANLTVSLDFYRNNGGRGQPGYQRLLVARRQQKDNQWENLPYAVRTRVSDWFTCQRGERFLGFYADEDFSRSESGVAGLVLTDQRLVYRKYACCLEYSITKGGQVSIEATRARATIDISQDGKEEVTCNTRPLAAGALARTLTELSPAWQINVHTS